ncbi:MAG: hypothetical protein MJZ02_00535 [Paludibacteraceae bacterium]|nr:hypothetical protein [Paludibacteraceae bacterium]
MKALHIIASLATAALLIVAAPEAYAQRGAMQRTHSQGSGHDTRGSHSAAASHGGGNHTSAAPSHNGGNQSHQAAAPRHDNRPSSVNSRPMGRGGNPVRNAPGGHTYGHHAPAPQHHHAPAPQHHHAPAPQHHHAPAPQHHHAPAPRHYAAPAPHHHHSGPRYAARPRHVGHAPVYHQHIDRRARVFYIDEVPYYSWGGVYYRYIPSYGYEEIYMPQDVVVTELPYGAAVTYVNNIGYYEADGMWFQPVEGGYLLVERPVAKVTVAVPRPTVSFHASFGF